MEDGNEEVEQIKSNDSSTKLILAIAFGSIIALVVIFTIIFCVRTHRLILLAKNKNSSLGSLEVSSHSLKRQTTLAPKYSSKTASSQAMFISIDDNLPLRQMTMNPKAHKLTVLQSDEGLPSVRSSVRQDRFETPSVENSVDGVNNLYKTPQNG